MQFSFSNDASENWLGALNRSYLPPSSRDSDQPESVLRAFGRLRPCSTGVQVTLEETARWRLNGAAWERAASRERACPKPEAKRHHSDSPAMIRRTPIQEAPQKEVGKARDVLGTWGQEETKQAAWIRGFCQFGTSAGVRHPCDSAHQGSNLEPSPHVEFCQVLDRHWVPDGKGHSGSLPFPSVPLLSLWGHPIPSISSSRGWSISLKRKYSFIHWGKKVLPALVVTKRFASCKSFGRSSSKLIAFKK